MIDCKFRKILVTGGSGFIGANFLNQFVPMYPDIQFINLDKVRGDMSGNIRSNVFEAENYEQRLFDIGTEGFYNFISLGLDRHLCDADAIIHFAAETHVDRSIENPSKFVYSNVVGTLNMLELARLAGVKRFHHISTDEVYGNIPQGSAVEEMLLETNSPYSATKAGSDLLVQSYGTTFGINYVITRASNNFGPYQDTTKAMPHWIRAALSDRELIIYDDGSQTRDWLYVIDHVRAIWNVFNSNFTNEVVNIGGNCTLTNLEVVEKILTNLRKPKSLIQFKPNARPGHDQRYALNTAKYEHQFGKISTIPFDELLNLTIIWYSTEY